MSFNNDSNRCCTARYIIYGKDLSQQNTTFSLTIFVSLAPLTVLLKHVCGFVPQSTYSSSHLFLLPLFPQPNCSSAHLFLNQPVHPPTCSSSHLFLNQPVHPPTCSSSHLFLNQPVHPLTCSSSHLFLNQPVYPTTCSSSKLFLCPPVAPLTLSFSHPFPLPPLPPPTCSYGEAPTTAGAVLPRRSGSSLPQPRSSRRPHAAAPLPVPVASFPDSTVHPWWWWSRCRHAAGRRGVTWRRHETRAPAPPACSCVARACSADWRSLAMSPRDFFCT